jgi:hypothetical protein
MLAEADVQRRDQARGSQRPVQEERGLRPPTMLAVWYQLKPNIKPFGRLRTIDQAR